MATNTAASFTSHTGNGGAGPFSISFSYQSEDEIDVTVDGVLKTKTTHYTFPSATTISFTSGNHPANSAAIKFQRDTNISAKKVDFVDGAILTEADLDTNTEHLLFGLQEVLNHVDTKEFTSAQIQDGTIVNADINASAAIAGTKISPNFGSQNIATSGTVDGRDVSADGSKLDGIEAGAKDDQTAAEIRTLVESATDSNVFTDADHTKLNGIDTGAKDDQTAAEIKTLLQSDKLTASEIADGTITATQIATGALDGRYYTETESDAKYFNVSTGDTIKDGDAFPDNDTTIATTAAINDRIIDLVDDVGGFVPIANETSFPAANPDVNNGTGTLVSVKAFASSHTPSGGTVTIANGAGSGNTVTITGCGSTVLAAGFGGILETTSTLHTYTFHRLTPKATEVTTVAGISANITTVAGISANVTTVAGSNSNVTTVATNITNVNNVGGSIANVNTVATNLSGINDFAARYRVASSDPTSNLDVGDLVFNSSSNELRVYNGSAWQAGVTATGNLVSKSGDQMTGNLTFSGSQTVDGRDVSVDGAKLDGIATNANNYSIATDLLDEDNFATNSATKVASQQSIKAYVDANAANTTYAISCVDGDNTDEEKIRLTAGGSGSGTDDIVLEAGTGLSIARSSDKITFTNTVSNTDTQLTEEQVEDFVGGMLTGNTETGITVTYQDADGTIDFVVDLLDEDNFATDSATKPPSQQSVKAYVDTADALKANLSGATFTGDVTFDGATAGRDIVFDRSDNALEFADSAYAKFGSDETDLQIYHDSGNSWIKENGTGILFIDSTNGSEVRISSDSNSKIMAQFVKDGACQFRHNNNLKLVTSATGATLTGTLVSDGLTVDGDVTLTGASANVTWNKSTDDLLFNDNATAIFGTNSDGLEIWHSGSHSFIEDKGTGNLYISAADNLFLRRYATNETFVKCISDGAVELFYDGGTTPKLETTSDGAKVTGNFQTSHSSNNDVLLNAGDGSIEICRSGSAAYIDFKNSISEDYDARLQESSGGITCSGSLSDSKGDLRSIPQNTQGSAYELLAADAGKHILASGNITWVDSRHAAGDAITIVNNTAGDITITKGTTMYNTADGNNANRTLATRGMATILWTSGTVAYISGSGLS